MAVQFKAMRVPSLPFAALALLTAIAFPMACATGVRSFDGDGDGGDNTSSGNAGGGGASSSGGVDAGPDAPPGTCLKAADCSALNDACSQGTCVNGKCEKAPANDFASCDDGLYCTQDDTCKDGQCVGGTAKYCASVGTCLIGICNENTDNCETVPGNDGALCDDADPCTQGSLCSAGTCAGGNPIDCSALDGVCAIGVCDPQKGCVQQPAPDGTACNDGLYCMINEVCMGGLCAGQPNSCAAPGDVCLVGSCNEAQDQCTTVPGPNGIQCDDGNLCTMSETCNGGVCNGGAPANQGGACDDKNDCTAVDVCANGKCAGTPIVNCINGDGCCAPGCTLAQDDDCNALGSPTYDASMTFQDALMSTTMTLAWDGNEFWSCSGGSNGGVRLARYSALGALVNSYQPGIDFRSVFTKGDGTSPVYAREYGSQQIRVQAAAGSFNNGIVLNGGAIDAQSAVVYDAATSQFVALNAGTVTRWTDAGAFVSNTTLVGFGNLNGENVYPQNRGIIAKGGLYLTYSNGVISSWDQNGQRQKTSVLNGAGVGFDSHFSLSYGKGMVWIVDAAGGTWRGYNVGI